MSVVLCDLSFSWPNGRAILSGLNAAFGPGRTGLIGVNGSGKSTLLRPIAGELRPTSGSVTVTGDVGYLPQDLTLEVGAPVASLLGIAPVRDAIRAIESGDARRDRLVRRGHIIELSAAGPAENIRNHEQRPPRQSGCRGNGMTIRPPGRRIRIL